MLIYFIYLLLSIVIDFFSYSENIYNVIFIRHLFICLLNYKKEKFNLNSFLRGLLTFGGFMFYLKVLSSVGVFKTTILYYLIPIFDCMFLIIKRMERVSLLSLFLYLCLLIYMQDFINIYAILGAFCFSFCNILIKKSNGDMFFSGLIVCLLSIFFSSNFSIKIYFIGFLGAILNFLIIYLIKSNSFEKYHIYQFLDVIFLSIFYSSFNFIFYFALLFICLHYLKRVK